MPMTRRALITIGAVTALAPTVAGARPANAAQPTEVAQQSGAVSVRRVGTTSSVFGADHRSVVALEELRALVISGPVAALSGGTVVIRYDARVSTLSSSCSVVQVGRATHVILMDADTRAGVVRLQLPAISGTAPSGGVVVSVPLRRSAAFPADGIDAPAGTTIEVLSAAGPMLTRSLPTAAPPVTGTAWGGQLAAVWQPVTLPGNNQYAVPAFLRISSVGPGPIPAGTHLQVTVDPRLARITTLRLLDATGTARRAGTITHHADRSTVTLLSPIAADDAVTVMVTAAPNAARTLPTDVHFAAASLTASNYPDPWQRSTGAETITALSASGTPRTPDAFTGRI